MTPRSQERAAHVRLADARARLSSTLDALDIAIEREDDATDAVRACLDCVHTISRQAAIIDAFRHERAGR